MENKSKIVISLIVLALLVIALFAFTFTGFVINSQGSSNKEPIKIGGMFALTGKSMAIGEIAKSGAVMAVEEINSRGGIDGRKIEFILEDDKDDAAEAVTAVQKLINVDNVRYIIGGTNSITATPIVTIAQDNKVIFLTTTATADKVNSAGDYVFKLQEGTDAHARKITSVMDILGVKTLSIIQVESEFCTDLIGYLKKRVAERNIEVKDIEAYKSTDNDYRTQLANIKEEDSDALYLCSYYKDGAAIAKQARELGITKQLFSASTVENPDFIKIAGEAGEGLIYTTTSFDCGVSKQFCYNFQEKFNKKPDYRAAYAYDAVYILANAIEKAGNNKEKVKLQLLKTNYNGISGRTILDSEGNAKRDFILRIIKNQQFVKY
jgi:branched-chain amino acid transport system substrate-binding protein